MRNSHSLENHHFSFEWYHQRLPMIYLPKNEDSNPKCTQDQFRDAYCQLANMTEDINKAAVCCVIMSRYVKIRQKSLTWTKKLSAINLIYM